MSSSTRWTIREAQRADVPAIAALAAEFAEYMRSLGDTSEFRLDTLALERDGFGSEPAFRGLVAEGSGQVAGYLLYYPGYDTDAACRILFVADLFVTGSLRGQGVGAALMDAARSLAAGQGAKLMAWAVHRRNTSARRFYEQLGAHYVEDLDWMYLDV